MANKKTIPDEQIIAALLSHGTIKAAAAAVGLSERAVYDRMNAGEFQALYKAAKADLIRAAVFNINSQLEAAITTVAEIMSNPDNNAAVRLQAAQTILNNAGKFAQRLQIDETGVINQLEDNAMRYVRI
jgi:hypothetical protein